MSPMLQSEIIIFAIPQQHRVNLNKSSFNLTVFLFFSEAIPTVITDRISVVLRKNEHLPNLLKADSGKANFPLHVGI